MTTALITGFWTNASIITQTNPASTSTTITTAGSATIGNESATVAATSATEETTATATETTLTTTGNTTPAAETAVDYSGEVMASQVLNAALIIIALYFTSSYIFYGRSTGKWRRRRKDDFSGGVVLALAAAGSALVLPRLVASRVVLQVGGGDTSLEDFRCEIAMDMSIAFFFFALIPTYTYLWVRQRALYRQPSIKTLYSTWIRILCWSSYVFPFISGVAIVVIFVLPDAYRGSEYGCVLKSDEEDNVLPFYGVIFIQVFGQLLLLGLFVYPLHLHRTLQQSLASTLRRQRPSRDDVTFASSAAMTLPGVMTSPVAPSRSASKELPVCAPTQADQSGTSNRDSMTSIKDSMTSQACQLDAKTNMTSSTESVSSVGDLNSTKSLSASQPSLLAVIRLAGGNSPAPGRTLSASCLAVQEPVGLKKAPLRQSLGAVRRKLSVGIQKARGLSVDSTASSSGISKSRRRVFRVIRRSVVCTTVCIVSDLITMLVVAFLVEKRAPKAFTNTMYDLTLMVNVLSVIMSFENYPKILGAFCARKKKDSLFRSATLYSRSHSADLASET